MALSNQSELIALIHSLASQNRYYLKHHAQLQMIDRNMTLDDVSDILLNVTEILRVDTDNKDGITSYKIEGGIHSHRLAIKFTKANNIAIITVMDNEKPKMK